MMLWPLTQSYLFMVFIRKTSVVVDVTSYKLQRLIKIINYVIIGYYTKLCISRKGYDKERYQVILNKLLILGISSFFFPLPWILAIWLLTRTLAILNLTLIHFHCFRTCSWLSRTQITVLISWGDGGWAGGEDKDPERMSKLLKVAKKTSSRHGLMTSTSQDATAVYFLKSSLILGKALA